MDQLKEGIGLRSFAQRDPLIEYKKEGFQMFQMMYSSISQEVAETIFKIQPASPSHRLKGVFSSLPKNMIHNQTSGLADPKQADTPAHQPGQSSPQEQASSQPVRNDLEKVGRNDPCPCGSGKKYKKCCGQ